MKIEIIILGLLLEENLYGYEIKKKTVNRLGDYVDIKFGSIYYALKKSVDKGWVECISTEKDGGNPERYVYQIMPAGKKYYRRLLKQYFSDNTIHFDVDVVLMFFYTLEDYQKKDFIKTRMEIVQEKIDDLQLRIKNDQENQRYVYNYLLVHMNAELDWLLDLEKEFVTS